MSRAGRPPRGGLTPRQIIFVNAIVSGSTGKDAALKAGYSPKSAQVGASKLQKKPAVKAAIEAARAKQATSAGITRQWVIANLAKEAKDAPKAKDRIHATELLGKDLNMFVEQSEVTVVELTPEERLRRLEALAEKVRARAAGQ